VGTTAGDAVTVGRGAGTTAGVAVGVGLGVGLAVGLGVGFGVGVGLGVGAGVTIGFTTTTEGSGAVTSDVRTPGPAPLSAWNVYDHVPTGSARATA
jgi:hypothetical protein